MTKLLSINPTPKQEFLFDAASVKGHSTLIDAPAFQKAIKTALAQYVRVMCNIAPDKMDSPAQLQASAMCFQRIQGANDFVDTLLKLGQQPQSPLPKPNDNLKQN